MGFGYTLEVDASGDLVFDTTLKRHRLVEDAAALRQALRLRLKAIQTEDPIHPSVGLPLLEIFRGAFDKRLLESRVREQVTADPRVASLDNVEVGDPDANRKVKVTISGTAVDGTKFHVPSLLTVGG